MTTYADRRGTVSNRLRHSSEKQINFIKRLADERFMTDKQRKNIDDLVAAGHGSCSMDFAADVIDWLKRLPMNDTRKTRTISVDEGVYSLNGEIYKVQRSTNGSGRLYAKQLIADEFGSAHFEYAAGAIFKLNPEHKLTREQAKSWGALYGTCVRCGRTLTNEDSVDRMMGPVCFGKMGW